MKKALWVLLVFGFIVAVTAPLVYFSIKAQLPEMASELELYQLLKRSIEGERRAHALSLVTLEKKDITFERPDISRYPKHLVSLTLNERGCPRYFQTPRETGFPWAKRMVAFFFDNDTTGNDGWCEKVFGWDLAERIGADTHSKQVVATHVIHSFLTKDALLAYDLASTPFEDGVIGPEEAAHVLIGKKLNALSLAEMAEMALAMPPHGYWSQVKDCKNTVLLRQNRDVLIQRLRQAGLIPEDLAVNAQTQPLACTTRP
ncbi:MAG: transglycosylase domain-containing protein [Myxococcaceae bacterium]|nr:transglycosylase domain-containing protein [Myxococcaceae bacterium]